MMPAGFDGIICFGGDPWGEMKRPSQLMCRLSHYTPVVYIEPHLSATSVLKNWRAARTPEHSARLERALANGSVEVRPNLHVVSTLVWLPLHRMTRLLPPRLLSTLVSRQYAKSLAKARRAAERLGIGSPAVWVSYPLPLDETDDGWARVVYDCMDAWGDFPDSLSDAKWRTQIVNAEKALLDRAELVFCSAAGLFESQRSRSTGRVVLLRNGADIDHFAPAERSVPSDIAEIQGPIIGYVGAVAEWVDFELLGEVARLRPEWSIVLIGPSFKGRSMGDSRALSAIESIPNVHLLGPRPYEDVPAYVQSFSVATIPFKLNGLTRDTNPIKVYEYLAAGVPVVSTSLPEVESMRDVRLADTADQFVRACEAAMAERDDRELVARRIESAACNSWERRAMDAWAEMVG